MSVFDNIADFTAEEIPSPEKLNALRDAMIQAFSGNIDASNVTWPLVAQGPLDMNNNAILNVGNLNNIIHVNDTKSFPEAVADVNAAGGGHIIIDPQADASTSASGVTISASNVLISGGGGSSQLDLDDGTGVAITVTGSNVTFQDIQFNFPSAPAALTTAVYFDNVTRPIIRNCYFSGTGVGTAVKFGSTSTNINWPAIFNTTFYGMERGVYAFRTWGLQIIGCSFQEHSGTQMEHIFLSGETDSFIRGAVIAGNVFYSVNASASPAITAIYAAGVPSHYNITICNNYFYCPNSESLTTSGFWQISFCNNVCNADFTFGSSDSVINGNILGPNSATVTFAGAERVMVTGNYVMSDLTFTGTNDELAINNNYFFDDLTLPGADPGVRALFGNTIKGNFTLSTTLLAGNDMDFGMNRVEGGVV